MGIVCNECNSFNFTKVEICLNNKLPLIGYEYKDTDIFNVDKMALFYNWLSNKTLKFKGEISRSGKPSRKD